MVRSFVFRRKLHVIPISLREILFCTAGNVNCNGFKRHFSKREDILIRHDAFGNVTILEGCDLLGLTAFPIVLLGILFHFPIDIPRLDME